MDSHTSAKNEKEKKCVCVCVCVEQEASTTTARIDFQATKWNASFSLFFSLFSPFLAHIRSHSLPAASAQNAQLSSFSSSSSPSASSSLHLMLLLTLRSLNNINPLCLFSLKTNSTAKVNDAHQKKHQASSFNEREKREKKRRKKRKERKRIRIIFFSFFRTQSTCCLIRSCTCALNKTLTWTQTHSHKIHTKPLTLRSFSLHHHCLLSLLLLLEFRWAQLRPELVLAAQKCRSCFW